MSHHGDASMTPKPLGGPSTALPRMPPLTLPDSTLHLSQSFSRPIRKREGGMSSPPPSAGTSSLRPGVVTPIGTSPVKMGPTKPPTATSTEASLHLGPLLLQVLRLAAPITAIYFLNLLSQTLLMAFCGNWLDRRAFQAVGLGLAAINVFGYNPSMGFVAALDTLCGQEFGRNPNSPKIGLYWKLSLVINVILSLVFGGILTFGAESILRLLMASSKDSGSSNGGGDTLQLVSTFLSPSVWFLFFNLCSLTNAKTCQAQRLPIIGTIAAVGSSFGVPVLLFLLIGPNSMSSTPSGASPPPTSSNLPPITGSGAIAMNASSLSSPFLIGPEYTLVKVSLCVGIATALQFFISLTLMIFPQTVRCVPSIAASFEQVHRTSQLQDALCGLTREDIKTYLKIALPNIILVGGESAAFNFLNVMSGRLPSVAEGSAFLIMTNLNNAFFSLVFGPVSAICTVMGNALGKGDAVLSKKIAWIGLGLVVCISSSTGFMFLLFKDYILRFYTSDQEIIDSFNRFSWFFPLFMLGDHCQYAFQGIYGGAGKNLKGAAVMLSVMWGWTVPSVTMTVMWFPSWGVTGMVAVFGIGLVLLATTFFVVMVLTFDWDKLAADVCRGTNEAL